MGVVKIFACVPPPGKFLDQRLVALIIPAVRAAVTAASGFGLVLPAWPLGGACARVREQRME